MLNHIKTIILVSTAHHIETALAEKVIQLTIYPLHHELMPNNHPCYPSIIVLK